MLTASDFLRALSCTGMETSPEKSKVMAFLGKDPVRYKIFVDNKCLQQARNLKYLGCEISYENERIFLKKFSNTGNSK